MVMPKDLHLAKRYYDMALQTDPDSYIAVYLALLSLGSEYVYTQLLNGNLEIAGYSWDTWLIMGLCALLGVLLIVKQTRTLH